MSISNNLEFDYLTGAQAQKHLTVNNALARLDAATQWVVGPAASSSGDGTLTRNANGVDLDLWLNGGADVLKPKMGWRAYFLEASREMIFDGAAWKPFGAFFVRCLDYDLNLAKGETGLVPEKATVFGCTARVIEDIKGTNLTGWSLGLRGAPGRYGTNLWLKKNGWAKSPSGTPMTYWHDTPIQATGEGGEITGGRIALHIYIADFPLPPEVP